MIATNMPLPRALLAGALCACVLALAAGCDDDANIELPLTYDVPVQKGAYWPKFRRTARNTGFSPREPRFDQEKVWNVDTGKGIFSSPVIDKDGTIYVGSANAVFYAIGADGKIKWEKQLGELVDSSALIGADGTIYVGSGDGRLYAFDPSDGATKWTFRPRGGAFITWFEGNVTMGPDGTLYAGNDDFHLYAIDAATGNEKWAYEVGDQIWSAAAFDANGHLYFGSNDLRLTSLDPALAHADPKNAQKKAKRWTFAAAGSVVASPLVTSDGVVIVGAFDGYAYGVDATSGEQLWRLATREHIYASPAQGLDGTVYIASADGTLYAVAPRTGDVKWTFDILDPIRSSPAVDGRGTIYFGAGDGRLYAVNPDGTRRWSFDTSADDRNDLNASPALGRDAIIIAGEEGKIWSIPYDYCLRSTDPRCNTREGEDLPDSGASIYFLSSGGASTADPPASIAAGEAVALRLVVRKDGATVDAAIDPKSLKLTLTPAVKHTVAVAADGSFLVVVPDSAFAAGTEYTLRVSGDYLTGGKRTGNRVVGGKKAGTFERTMKIKTRARASSTAPAAITAKGADVVGAINLSRLAAPQPTLLPSYNQIGFDFMNLLISIVDYDASSGRVLAWVVPGTHDGQGRVIVDTTAAQRIFFPLVGTLRGSELVLESSSFTVEFGGVSVPLERLRIGASFGKDGRSTATSVYAATTCSKVEFYGLLLQLAGLCNPLTDQLVISGTALLGPVELERIRKKPSGTTAMAPKITAPKAPSAPGAKDGVAGSITVELSGALPTQDRVVSLLVLDPAGKPLDLAYSLDTKVARDAVGRTVALTLGTGQKTIAAGSTVIVMHDLYPLARFTTQ